MEELNLGKMQVLKQLMEDANSKVDGKAVSAILRDIINDEDGASKSTDYRAIREYGQEVIDAGAGLITAVKLICEHFGLKQKEFAAIIGTSETAVSLAMTGKGERETLLCKMTEFFGTDGGQIR